MADKTVRVGIWHGDEVYMTKATENAILSENVPNVARLLMDDLYLRVDDQVSAAQLRAHRRDLRRNKRDKAVNRGDNGE